MGLGKKQKYVCVHAKSLSNYVCMIVAIGRDARVPIVGSGAGTKTGDFRSIILGGGGYRRTTPPLTAGAHTNQEIYLM